MRYAIRRFCAAILLAGLTLLSVACVPASAQDTQYARIGWWSIEYVEGTDLNGCIASTLFTDQTTVSLALLQGARGKGWILVLSNPKWQAWLGNRTQVRLTIVTTKSWNESFEVSEKKLLTHVVSVDFVNSVADAHSLTIYDDRSRRISGFLDMKDSEAAIKSVVNCVREHPPTRRPPPEAQNPPGSVQKTTLFGTGFFVEPNLILTNDHVVRRCTQAIHVRYAEAASSTATVTGFDQTNDLALLRTEMKNVSVATFRIRPRLGESVATYGFPYAGILSSSGNFTLGNVTSLTGIRDDTRFLQISTPIQPGNSGGPLVDMSGRVVGVVVSQLNALEMMKAGNSVPQNVNFAIQTPIAINFLAIKGVKPKVDSSPTAQALSPSDVADLARQFTVQVYCEGTSSKTSASASVSESTFDALAVDLIDHFKPARPSMPGRTVHRVR